MRDVEVEAGGRKLIFTMREAKEWADAGLARWEGRNRLRITARCDSKAMLRGLSSIVGKAIVESPSELWLQMFIQSVLKARA
jgi:hypothetical protein